MSDRIDNKDIVRLLTKLDERLTNIENKISREDGSWSGSSRPKASYSRSVHSQHGIVCDGSSDNALNKQLEELNIHGPSSQSQMAPTTGGRQKSASFRDKPSKRLYESSKRHSYSIPPDKEEHRRRSQFRRECLSKAIQWNLVDIVSSLNGISENTVLHHLPYWLTKNHIMSIRSGKNEKSKIRKFLLILMEQSFEVMSEWLGKGFLQAGVFEMIWKTFEEFSDKATNTMTVKCFLCRLIATIPADYVIDYLMSADIISKATFLDADNSLLFLGADSPIWINIIKDCKAYCFPKRAVDALKVALNDAIESEDFDKEGIDGLLGDIDKYESDSRLLFDCQCSALCTRSLHPVSVMKSMSMVEAYMLPQKPKPTPENRYNNSTDTPSPASSFDSVEKSSEWDLRLSDEEQTFQKSACAPSDEKSTNPKVTTGLGGIEANHELFNNESGQRESVEVDTKPQSYYLIDRERSKRRMSKKAVRRRQDQSASQTSSTSTEGSSEIEQTSHNEKPKASSALAQRRYANYTQHKSTQALQNNPQIIYGKNVYISHI